MLFSPCLKRMAVHFGDVLGIHQIIFFLFFIFFLVVCRTTRKYEASFRQECTGILNEEEWSSLSVLCSDLTGSVQFSSVAQSCPTLCDPMNRSNQASLSITNSQSSLRLTSIESVMPSSHLILCHPLLLLPPILPSIRGCTHNQINYL